MSPLAAPEPTPGIWEIEQFDPGKQDRENDPASDYFKELVDSIVRNGLLQPPGVIDRPENNLIYGFRRFDALKAAGIRSANVLIYPAAITETQIRVIRATENLQRLGLTPYQEFRLAVELMELNPDWHQKDLAAHLSKNVSTVSRMLSPLKCIPEVLDALKEDKIHFKLIAEIARLNKDEQFPLLQLHLGGATVEQVTQQAKKPKNAAAAPTEGVARPVKIPLAVNTDALTANGTVTVAGLPGDEIDIESVESLLRAALSAVKEAKKRNWNLKAAMAAWKSEAAAG